MSRIEQVQEPEQGSQEQRRHIRKRVLWAAKLETESGSFGCIILNVSRSGAKLRLTAPVSVTPQQRVELAFETFGTLSADVVWQRGEKVGIRFTADPAKIASIIGSSLSL